MGQVEWVNPRLVSLVKNEDFIYRLGDTGCIWTCDADWDIDLGVATFFENGNQARRFIRQNMDPPINNIWYTVVIHITAMVKGNGEQDGIGFEWGNFSTFMSYPAGFLVIELVPFGVPNQFRIWGPHKDPAQGSCTIDFCHLYPGRHLQGFINWAGLGFFENLYGELYDRGGGRYTPFYCQKRGSSKIWIASET